MKELVVCSGKGGTGKTSVVAGLASLAGEFVLADCDVDAANLHLVLAPEIESSHRFMAGHEAVIRPADCLNCGTCFDVCRYEAVHLVETRSGESVHAVDQDRCEGCGVCVHFCPEDAIDFPVRQCGSWFVSRTAHGPMVHARLEPGAENSGKLVTKVREQARLAASAAGRGLILIDGPPGIGCPASAAITGADLALLVTEPGLSALHDLRRIADLVDRFGLPAVVCLNRFDLSPPLTDQVEEFCSVRGLPLVGKIPFDPLMNEAQAAGTSLVDFAPRCETAKILSTVWRHLDRLLAGTSMTKG